MESISVVDQARRSAPPAAAVAAVAAAVEQEFGLSGDYLPLVSERDQNFHLRCADGQQFVVKVTNAAEAAVVSDFHVQLLLYLQQTSTVGTPQVRLTTDGRTCGDITADGRACRLRVVSYLAGSALAQAAIDAALAHEFGRQLAELGRGLRGFSHAGEKPPLLWDLQRVAELRPLQHHIDDRRGLAAVAAATDDFEERIVPLLEQLPVQVIHGDPNPENVLLGTADRRFSGFIDFSDAIRAPRVFDVAIAASYLRSDGPDALRLIVPFVSGYTAVTPLQDNEIATLFDLVRARLVTTITLLYWRLAARDEHDPYRQKTLQLESGAIDFLHALDSLGRVPFTERLRQSRNPDPDKTTT
jgi:Ser/Thr protein kinase RdoA (MazF antagonist)